MRPKHMYVCSYSILARTSAIRIGPTQGKQDTDEILDELFPEFESSDDGIEEAPAEVEPPLPPPVPVFGVVARPAPAQDAHMENASVASSSRDDASCVVLYPPYGFISYYKKGCRFQATCFDACAQHGKCRLTRYAGASSHAPSKGRPLGLMAAWLRFSHEVASHQEHINYFSCRRCLSTEGLRVARICKPWRTEPRCAPTNAFADQAKAKSPQKFPDIVRHIIT
jgi:hypothetical protein